jgi:hypothetical protein
MTWQEEDQDNLRTQLRSQIRGRVVVPMEEREARANRFVSLLVGHTESPKPLLSSSKVRRSLPDLRHPVVELQRLVAEGRQLHQEDRVFLDLQQDQPNR